MGMEDAYPDHSTVDSSVIAPDESLNGAEHLQGLAPAIRMVRRLRQVHVERQMVPGAGVEPARRLRARGF